MWCLSYLSFIWLCYFLFCFVFFKQKTAYDMRISDWSSDVCSSDLVRMGSCGFWRAEATHPRSTIRRLNSASSSGWRISWKVDPCLEIGRESCRERVCQYV